MNKKAAVRKSAPIKIVKVSIDDYGNDVVFRGIIHPDIDVNMRGDEFSVLDDHTIQLDNSVFIIDGQQRRAGALRALESGYAPRLGVLVSATT